MGGYLGTIRSVYVVALASIGSFLFAFDTGIVGGVLTLESFQRDFRYTVEEKNQVNANCVSLLQAGAFFGCFLTWPIAAQLGRRWALMIASVVFCVGTTLQVLNTHSLRIFYAGRVIMGFALGGTTVLVPIYSAEVAPKKIRGKLGGFFELFFTLGVAISYWVDFAVSVAIKSSSKQWQVPIGLQLGFGALLGLGMISATESPRWLVKKRRNEQAYTALLWLRGGVESDEVKVEFHEILAGVEHELQDAEGFSWKELLLPSNRQRLITAVTLQLANQCGGNPTLTYFAPQMFATMGAGDKSIFLTGFFGVVRVMGVIIFILFLVERVGRKKPFTVGALTMGSFMLIIGVLLAVRPSKDDAASAYSFRAAAVAMVYLEAFSFQCSWGPLCWIYTGEIFPSRTREIGIATGIASSWLFSFGFSRFIPHALDNLGWRMFLIFAVFDYVVVVYTYFVIRETKGLALEDMETLFSTAKSTDDFPK